MCCLSALPLLFSERSQSFGNFSRRHYGRYVYLVSCLVSSSVCRPASGRSIFAADHGCGRRTHIPTTKPLAGCSITKAPTDTCTRTIGYCTQPATLEETKNRTTDRPRRRSCNLVIFQLSGLAERISGCHHYLAVPHVQSTFARMCARAGYSLTAASNPGGALRLRGRMWPQMKRGNKHIRVSMHPYICRRPDPERSKQCRAKSLSALCCVYHRHLTGETTAAPVVVLDRKCLRMGFSLLRLFYRQNEGRDLSTFHHFFPSKRDPKRNHRTTEPQNGPGVWERGLSDR